MQNQPKIGFMFYGSKMIAPTKFKSLADIYLENKNDSF